MEFCRTRIKKSSPDIFNFYVHFASHDMVTDAGRATTCRCKFKDPSLYTKSTKNEGHSKNLSFSKNRFEDFNEKKIKETFSLTKQPRGAHGP